MKPPVAKPGAVVTSGKGVLVDSNVLIDVLANEGRWAAWSAGALAACLELGPVIINPIIYAEVSTRFPSAEALSAAFPADIYRREPLPWAAAFLAGKGFLAYKRRGGTRTAPLPDFYIGAHAQVEQLVLLTRDAARYRTYFPTVELLTPA